MFRLRVIAAGKVDDGGQTAVEDATGVGAAAGRRPAGEASGTEPSQAFNSPTSAGTSVRQSVPQTGARTGAGSRRGADAQRRHPIISGGVSQ